MFLLELLKTLGVSRLHVQHIIGFTEEIVSLIGFVKHALSIPADITLHDYSPLCSHVHQFDHSELYFGKQSPHYCEACLKKYGAPAATQETQAWRGKWKTLIDGSENVFVPSRHLEHAMKHYFPHPNYRVRPHPEPRILQGFVPARWKIDDPLTLGIIGAIGEHKGARLLLAMAKDAEKRKLPIRFKIIGYSSLDHEFAGTSTISITGKFSDETLPKYLEQTGVNAIFLPSICPESFSFVLSISYFGGFFPIVFDIGAQAERVKEAGFGEVIPATLMQDIAALNDRLCALRFKYPSPYSMKTGEELYPNFLKDYYSI
jgi:glycosyltransferase involved in cell wall biosynthesis